MKYSDKLKKSKKILNSIYSLKAKEQLKVTYGTERYDNKPREFRNR